MRVEPEALPLADAYPDPLHSSFHATRNYCEVGSRPNVALFGYGASDGMLGVLFHGCG